MTRAMTPQELWDYCLRAGRIRREGVSQNEYDEYRERHRQKWQHINLASAYELRELQQERGAMVR